MTAIDNQVIENFFKSLQNTEKDLLFFESFENSMEKTPNDRSTQQRGSP